MLPSKVTFLFPCFVFLAFDSWLLGDGKLEGEGAGDIAAFFVRGVARCGDILIMVRT